MLAYAGNPSFWGMPETQHTSDADIVVMGVPFDAGTTNRPGARFGPRSIREIPMYDKNSYYPWRMSSPSRLFTSCGQH